MGMSLSHRGSLAGAFVFDASASAFDFCFKSSVGAVSIVALSDACPVVESAESSSVAGFQWAGFQWTGFQWTGFQWA